MKNVQVQGTEALPLVASSAESSLPVTSGKSASAELPEDDEGVGMLSHTQSDETEENLFTESNPVMMSDREKIPNPI